MRGKLGILLGVLVFVTGVVSWSAPAMARLGHDAGVVQRPAHGDARAPGPHDQADPVRLRRVARTSCCRPATRSTTRSGSTSPLPCTNCYITDMVPSLVYMGDANHADGTDGEPRHRRDAAPLRDDQPRPAGPGLPGRARGPARRALLRRGQRAQPDAPARAVRIPEQQRTVAPDLAHHQQEHDRARRASRSRSSSSTAPSRAAAPRPSRCGSTSTAAATPSTRRRSATTTRRSTGSRTSAGA